MNNCVNKKCGDRVAPGRYLCPACRLVWRVGLFLGGFVVGAIMLLLKLGGKL